MLSLSGGAGGASACGSGGAAGPGLALLDGIHTSVSGPVATLVATSPVRENDTVTVTVTGTPGDGVVLLVAANSRQIDLGTIPASGTIVATFSAGTVPSPLEYVNVYLQALVTSGGTTITGPGSAVSVLDSQF